MAETRNRFMENADRLEGVVRVLKTRQIEENQGPVQFASSRMTAQSPDELWAKQFATQCIGPVCFKVAPGTDMALPPLTQAMQMLTPAQQSAYAPEPVRETVKPATAPAVKSAKPAPMGAAIGKPMRRGVFARMFSR